MRVAAIYDVHGNLPALEAVLNDIRRVGADEIAVGGDVVPGPMPHACIACLQALEIPTRFIKGNGDREVLAQRAGRESAAIPKSFRECMRWNAQQLSDEEAKFLTGWAPTLRLVVMPRHETILTYSPV